MKLYMWDLSSERLAGLRDEARRERLAKEARAFGRRSEHAHAGGAGAAGHGPGAADAEEIARASSAGIGLGAVVAAVRGVLGRLGSNRPADGCPDCV